MQRVLHRAPFEGIKNQDSVVCFYCQSSIGPNEDVVCRGQGKYYHRQCFQTLFTLTSNCVKITRTVPAPRLNSK